MHVSLTRVETRDEPIENATIVAQEMLGWLRELEGFEGFLMLSREGETIGLTFWESREIAERHGAIRTQFVGRMASVVNLEIAERKDFEVTFAELGDLRAP